MKLSSPAIGLLACALSGSAFAQSSTVEGFDGGTNGGFTGNAFFEATGGNPDGNAHHFATIFFNDLRTGGLGEPVNANFVGDYSGFDNVTFSLDVKVESLTDFIGNQIIRPLGIALVDRDIQGVNGASGIFFELPPIGAALQPDWTNMSVTIADPTSATLPAGWIGFGDEDPNTFEPQLPAGATFATVLAGVDEFRITGAVPGFFFTNATYDMRIDNVSVSLGDGTLGTDYCAQPIPNSTGVAATLAVTGSAVVADNDVQLTASSLPLNQSGLFLASRTQDAIVAPGCCSVGTLCISGDFARFSGQVCDSGTTGDCSIIVDTTNILTNPPQPILAGQTWNFQLWHRDEGGSSNFTQAVSVQFN